MSSTKRWIWNRYFHYKSGDQESRDKAEAICYQTAGCLAKLLEGKSRLSIIAKGENKVNSYLMLRGFCNLNSTCAKQHVKKLIGKYSNCKPAVFSDVIMLMKYFFLDRHLMVTGRIPSQGNNSTKTMKSYATDARFLVKTLLEEIEKQDFDNDSVKVKSD